MGNHRTEKRRLTRLQKSINQEARILQLQLALDAAQQVGQNGTGAVHKEIPLVSPAQHSSQQSSDPESPMAIEDIKLPPNDEAHTIHVFQPDYDAEESAEVLHLETIGCSSGDVDVHALDGINFHGAGTHEPTNRTLFVPVFGFVIKTILWQEVVSPSGDFIVSSIAE